MRTLKVLGYLLTYPEMHHKETLQECMDILKAEKWLGQKNLEAMQNVMEIMRRKDIFDLQEDYVALFDRTPSLSLHLFEHIHGDSRDRGQALADLMQVYADSGLILNAKETPDYLPLFAEYAATLPHQEASETMGSVVNILSSIAERLRNRESFYAAVFEAFIETAARAPDAAAVEKYLKESSGAPLSTEEIDKEWEEQFAFENTSQTTQAGGCPKAEEMLARMNNYKEERI